MIITLLSTYVYHGVNGPVRFVLDSLYPYLFKLLIKPSLKRSLTSAYQIFVVKSILHKYHTIKYIHNGN